LREEKDRDTILIELLVYYAGTWLKKLGFSKKKKEGETHFLVLTKVIAIAIIYPPIVKHTTPPKLIPLTTGNILEHYRIPDYY
jgi:hypothetical protein